MQLVSTLGHTFRNSFAGRWYYGRERSEQRIISGLFFVVIMLLLWAFVWKPVADWRSLEQNRQTNAQQTLDWLQANRQAVQQSARQNTNPSSGRALIPIINRTAQAHDIAVNSLTPESNGVIGVMLQAQSFNQIVSWVAQLEENNAVHIQRASFDEQGAPGYVNAQLRLN